MTWHRKREGETRTSLMSWALAMAKKSRGKCSDDPRMVTILHGIENAEQPSWCYPISSKWSKAYSTLWTKFCLHSDLCNSIDLNSNCTEPVTRVLVTHSSGFPTPFNSVNAFQGFSYIPIGFYRGPTRVSILIAKRAWKEPTRVSIL